jgi:hypothetical protein
VGERFLGLADAGGAAGLQAHQGRPGQVGALVALAGVLAEVDAADGELGHRSTP